MVNLNMTSTLRFVAKLIVQENKLKINRQKINKQIENKQMNTIFNNDFF